MVRKPKKNIFIRFLQLTLLQAGARRGAAYQGNAWGSEDAWCVNAKDEHLDLTRSRPYEKNDNFLVEQKNGRVVRRWMGYRRHDTIEELRIMNELRRLLGLYQNFF